MRREARSLKAKAVASLKRALATFNDLNEEGRTTGVLLHMQHAFEMLLKAALVHKGWRVFDPRTGKSYGMDKCLNVGKEALGLRDEDVGLVRAIDAMRDDEQHWFNVVSEGILYTHCRAAVTLFDSLLDTVFEERLAEHLPLRVLPVSTEPPADIQVLVDREYTQVQELLKPGRRRTADARARIRALLAMEAHASDEVEISAKDVNRVEKAVRKGLPREGVFPRLSHLATTTEGDGVEVKVRFDRREGMPVRYVKAGERDEAEAASIREVDLQRKYHWSATELAEKVGLSAPKALALRRHLRIDENEDCVHDFVFGSQRHRQYSDNALTLMRNALKEVDMAAVWEQHRPRARRKR